MELESWPTNGFRQLKVEHIKDIPDLSDEGVTAYFDSAPQAQQKGRLLASAGRIVACSMQAIRGQTLISLICRASIKKKVSKNREKNVLKSLV